MDTLRIFEELLIVGECKSQLSKNNMDNFLKRLLQRLDAEKRKTFPIIVAHIMMTFLKCVDTGRTAALSKRQPFIIVKLIRVAK